MSEPHSDHTVRLEGSPSPKPPSDASGPPTGLSLPPTPTAGSQIGRYKLIQNIGEGGFGNVYLAEQHEPIRRRVALKIIKLGLDTRQFIARFEAERQALAMMDHPCIAKVLDAGATAAGRPYFVMELVRGLSITEYCDKQRLSIRDRVVLFINVCGAVQHAHQKGIIHRDIKPSNIMVTIQEGEPLPKVIDFGVAKAVQQPLTDKTMYTEVGQFIGTPNYMSPEQAEAGALDVDTRSDIYSLGVVLYELLAGVTPFDTGTVGRLKMAEVFRKVIEDDPPRPSTRFAALKEERSTIAQRRSTEPARLPGTLRNELDWIVLKALEKDRTRRYETAAAMANDLRRYLNDEPVSASPPGAGYKFRKFMRRHRAAAALVAALLLGASGTAGGLILAYRQKAKTAAAEASQARAAGALTDQRARELQTVIDFQGSILNEIDAATMGEAFSFELHRHARQRMEDQGEDATAVAEALAPLANVLASTNMTDVAMAVITSEILAKAESAVDEGFRDRPLIRAGLQLQLAEVHAAHHLLEAADRLQDSAYKIRLEELGANHPDTLHALSAQADVLLLKGDYAGAERLYRVAIGGLSAASDPRAIEAKGNLAVTLQHAGQLAEAEGLTREVYAARLSTFGPDAEETLTPLSNLASILQLQGKLPEAADISRQVLAAAERALGDEAPMTLTALHSSAFILQSLGRHAEAVPLYRRKLEASERLLGTNHQDTLLAANNLAAALREMGKLEEAEKYYRMALEGERRILGPDHPSVFVTLNNLASLLQAQRKLAEVEILLREALAGLENSVGADHVNAIVVRGNLAWTLIKMERFAEAESLAADAASRAKRALGEDHWVYGLSLSRHGEALCSLDRFAEAEPRLLKAFRVVETALGSDHEHAQSMAALIDSLYRAWHETEPAAGHNQKVGNWREHAQAETTQSPN